MAEQTASMAPIAIGTVIALEGSAQAKNPVTGEVRDLQIGDMVYADEIIITADNSAIAIEFSDGTRMDLGRNSQVALDNEVFDVDTHAARMAALERGEGEDALAEGGEGALSSIPGLDDPFSAAGDDAASIDAIQQALLAGADPTQELEATAAGPASGGGGEDEGSNFVILERSDQATTPDSGFSTDPIAPEFPPIPEEDLITEEEEPVEPPPEDLPIEASVEGTTLDETFLESQLSVGSFDETDTGAMSGGAPIVITNGDGPFSAAFSPSLHDTDSGFTSQGQPIFYYVTGDGQTLYAIVGEVATQGDDIGVFGRVIFTANIEAGEGGLSYNVVLNDQVDHNPEAGADQDAVFGISIDVTDANDDSVTLPVNVTVEDDRPFAENDGLLATVTEGDGATSVAGGLLDNDEIGADEAGYRGQTFVDGPTEDEFPQGVQLIQAVPTGGAITMVGDTPIADFGFTEVPGQYGTLNIDSFGNWTYQVDASVNHTDSDTLTEEFTYTIEDADGDTDTATFSINVLDTAPTAEDDDGGEVVEGAAAISSADDGRDALFDNDTDGQDTVSLTSVNGTAFTGDGQQFTGQYGTLTVNADGSWSYKAFDSVDHTSSDSLTDTFSYIVTDSDNDPATADLTIDVLDTAPAAEDDDGGEVVEGAAAISSADDGRDALFDNDTDGQDTVSLTSVNGTAFTGDGQQFTGQYGTLTVNADGSWSYKAFDSVDHTSSDSLTDTFSYIVTDSDNDPATADLTIDVLDTAPAAEDDDGGEVVEGAAAISSADDGRDALFDNDTDGQDTVSLTSVNGTAFTGDGQQFTGQYGTLTVNADGSWSYKAFDSVDHTSSDSLTDTFSYIVTDSDNDPATADLTIDVLDTAPAAEDDDGGEVVEGAAAISSADDGRDALFDNDTDGQDTVSLTSVNGTAFTGDGQQFTGQYGTLTVNADGSWSYKAFDSVDHTSSDSLTDTFSYIVTDSDNDPATADLTIDVLDTAPAAEDDDGGEVVEGAAAISSADDGRDALFDNDTDGQDTVSLTSVNGTAFTGDGQQFTGQYGTLTVNADGSWSYKAFDSVDHTSSDSLTDTFSYIVTDSDNDPATADLTIDVLDTAPAAEDDDGGEVVEGAAAISSADDGRDALFDNDTDGQDTVSLTSVNGTAFTGDGQQFTGQYGTLTVNADGSWSYKAFDSVDHTSSDSLTDTFSYIVTDSDNDPATADLTIDVLDTAPAAEDDDGGEVVEGAAAISSADDGRDALFDNDTDGQDTVSLTSVNGTAFTGDGQQFTGQYGTLTVNADGSWSYKAFDSVDHTSSDSLTDTFSYIVTDSDNDPATADLTIDVLDTAPAAEDDDGGEVVEGAAAISSADDGRDALFDNDTDGQDTVSLTSVNGTAFTGDGQQFTGQYGTLTVNADGSWSYKAFDSVDHTSSDSLTDTFSYIVTDSDNDPATADLTIDVLDTAPVAQDAVLTVDEDGLPDGIEGGDGDVAGTAKTASGDLIATSGQDSITSVSFAALHGQSVVDTGNNVLESDDLPMTYSWDGSVLTASTSARDVFTLSVDQTSGAYLFALLAAVDHAVAGTEDDISLSLDFTVTDNDDSTSSGTVSITIDDDTPVDFTATHARLQDQVPTTVTLEDVPLNFGTATGADGVGDVVFTDSLVDQIALDVNGNELYFEGGPLYVWVNESGDLELRTETDGGGTVGLSITIDAENGTYDVVTNGIISNGSEISVPQFQGVGGGNSGATGIFNEGTGLTGDPTLGDMLLTSDLSDRSASVNTNNSEIGIGDGNQFDDGEWVRMDLVNGLAENATDLGFNYDTHISTTRFKQQISSSGNGGRETGMIIAAILANNNTVFADDSYVPLDLANIVIYDGDDNVIYDSVAGIDAGLVTVSDLGDKIQIIDMIGGTPSKEGYYYEIRTTSEFNAIEVTHVDGERSFKLGGFEYDAVTTGEPIELAYTLTGSDADSDTSEGSLGITLYPSEGAIIGTSGDDNISGTADSDFVFSEGGSDSISTLGGDDVIVADTIGDDIDGGAGNDTLVIEAVSGGVDMDLGTLFAAGNLSSIENIDMRNGESDSVSLSASDVVNVSDTNSLEIVGENSDSVTLDLTGATNVAVDTTTNPGTTVYTFDVGTDTGIEVSITGPGTINDGLTAP